MDGQNWSMHGEDGNFQTTEASLVYIMYSDLSGSSAYALGGKLVSCR